MNTALDDADDDLRLWSSHLDRTGSRNTVIENHLTGFLLVHVCGLYENEIEAMMLRRVGKSGDGGVTSYMASMLERRTPVHPNALKDVLRKFGGGCFREFQQNVDERDLRWYENMVLNRNSSAHGERIQINLDDVLKYHEGAKRVIKAFGRALNHAGTG